MSSTLERDLTYALDPAAFVRDTLGIELDAWQVDVLRSDAKRLLLNCCRQSGKSTMTAGLAVHQALYVPASLTLMLSPTQRQSGELFKKALDLYRALDHPVPSEAESALRLELANGSRIISLPGRENTIRGYSGVDLLVVDEASRVDDELFMAVRPMLAVSDGRMICPSTPWGKRGSWHKAWTEGEGWQRVRIPASECPRISPEFLEEERRALPPWFWSQEYDCQFSDTTDQVFGSDLVRASFAADVKPLFMEATK